ncbi:hypothetical protein TTHERM_00057200 (macronuclear) [Tetrahymena thermophila SB210]|uniref:Uncharacterized protein n=1 Tax=Tetrahymena thermophila (strain SB210) TaxID=312017 RepID=I7M6V0_TETTS|nr:hypothetical protein TTHERM_00057200 [Tetrahymena thermophila SB210]EAR87307.2 hypothetical protein TTHERM_00057200 [Tetrahymena thermophila SB210]|eukprot:XP_001007552.2 hypothetical protein TTHERM_00057200 [Tetrahymena thermophila SB210]
MPSVTDFFQGCDKENIAPNRNQQPSLCYLECENEKICYDGQTKFERNDFNNSDSILIANELVYQELKGFNFIQNINEIYNKMKICPKQLDLCIDIQFSQNHILINFANQISKIAKYTKNLKWNINSLIQLETKNENSLIVLTISKDFEEQLISQSIEYIQTGRNSLNTIDN